MIHHRSELLTSYSELFPNQIAYVPEDIHMSQSSIHSQQILVSESIPTFQFGDMKSGPPNDLQLGSFFTNENGKQHSLVILSICLKAKFVESVL